MGILLVSGREKGALDSLDHFYKGGGKQPKSPPVTMAAP
jgi:hypothetical protein